MKADKIIYGNIYTVDKKKPKAETVAIADGKFVYVGDEAGAKAYIGEGTEELRYEGGIILPGLGEGHGHVGPGGTEALFTVHLLRSTRSWMSSRAPGSSPRRIWGRTVPPRICSTV